MSKSAIRGQKAYPWVTPKIFPNPARPQAEVSKFFDHYAEWFDRVDEIVLNFCTGNADHVLNYRGRGRPADPFDWARYNSFMGDQERALNHNLDWLQRVREGGERSGNPYLAGPAVIINEAALTYDDLKGIYRCIREEAARRDYKLTLLEYLEPGAEFCLSTWKSERHPEAAAELVNVDGGVARLIDVGSLLAEDHREYASYPNGIPAGTKTADFIAEQAAVYVADFELDGVFLGNQFGLLGLWRPETAPEPTAERRAAVSYFFRRMRKAFGTRLIYWQDSFWPADVEIERWAMSEESYGLLDGILCSNFGVLVERMNVRKNVESKLNMRKKFGGRPEVIFSVDFVDPWYSYRIYLDDRYNFTFQHRVYQELGAQCNGISFFANDTFGHFVSQEPFRETLAIVSQSLATATL